MAKHRMQKGKNNGKLKHKTASRGETSKKVRAVACVLGQVRVLCSTQSMLHSVPTLKYPRTAAKANSTIMLKRHSSRR